MLLVGDVRLFRELLERAVEDQDGLEVVGTASVDVAAMAGRMFEPDIVVADSAAQLDDSGRTDTPCALLPTQGSS